MRARVCSTRIETAELLIVLIVFEFAKTMAPEKKSVNESPAGTCERCCRLLTPPPHGLSVFNFDLLAAKGQHRSHRETRQSLRPPPHSSDPKTLGCDALLITRPSERGSSALY